MKNFPVSKWKNIQKIPYFDNAVEYQSIFSSTIKFVAFQEEACWGTGLFSFISVLTSPQKKEYKIGVHTIL